MSLNREQPADHSFPFWQKRSRSTPAINQSELYEQLFSCIRKNKELNNLIDTIKPDDPKITQLLTAIQSGNADHAVFSQHDCDLYLLYLMKNGRIDSHHGMTVYIYLTFLREFTEKQPLKKEDQKYKNLREFKVGALCRDGQLTDDGMKYLSAVADNLKLFTKTDCFDELKNYILKLPASEQWVFQTRVKTDEAFFGSIFDKEEFQYGKGVDVVVLRPLEQRCIPYLQTLKQLPDASEGILHVPSVSLIRFCLAKMCAAPLEPAFVFGNTGFNKQHELHARERHPCLLYSTHVKSNALVAHDFQMGPVGSLLHDLIHCGYANALTHDYRELIYQFIIPELRMIHAAVSSFNDEFSANAITNFINQYGDYDLTGLATMEEEMKEEVYLSKAVFDHSRKSQHPVSDHLGGYDKDAVYYHMELCRLRQTHWNETQSKLWQDCMAAIATTFNCWGSMLDRVPLTDALKKLAQRTLQPVSLNADNHLFDDKIHWAEWLKLLNENIGSESLWKKIPEKLISELIILTNEYGLAFYHPYLPMTEEKRCEFRRFLEGKVCGLDAKSGCRP